MRDVDFQTDKMRRNGISSEKVAESRENVPRNTIWCVLSMTKTNKLPGMVMVACQTFKGWGYLNRIEILLNSFQIFGRSLLFKKMTSRRHSRTTVSNYSSWLGSFFVKAIIYSLLRRYLSTTSM